MTHASGNPNKHVPVRISADTSQLAEGDKAALPYLIAAVRGIGPIYLRQMNQNFAATGGIFDRSRGNNFYPAGLLREDILAYIDQHPDQRDALFNPFSVVERRGAALVAIPYAEFYREECEIVARNLEAAATLVTHSGFQNFLLGRARAFRTNSFHENDREWVQCTGTPIELIIGPFESYEDKILGIRRDFEGTLGIVPADEQRKIEQYQDFAIEFDVFLGRKYGYTPFYTPTRMTVVDVIITAGSGLYGFIAMADNLPDDEDIRRDVGSKKTFRRNMIEAKFDVMTAPIAQRTLGIQLDPEVFLQFIIGHELAHGLRFRFAGEQFGPLASPLEELKADVFGVLFLYFLAERGIVSREVAEESAMACIADSIREVRPDLEEAHAVGALIRFNWLRDADALRFEGERIALDRMRLFEAFGKLGNALLYALTQTHSPEAAAKFVGQWATVPEQLWSIVRSLEDLPIDIDPIFEV